MAVAPPRTALWAVAAAAAWRPLPVALLLEEAGEQPTCLEAGHDEHVSFMTNEHYFETRVLPLLEHAKSRAPVLRLKLWLLRGGVLICGTLATVLGALELCTWVPVAVSLSVVLTSMLQHFKYRERLHATTTAVGEFRALSIYWDALSTVARRMPEARQRLVDTAEGASMHMQLAWAGENFSRGLTSSASASVAPAEGPNDRAGEGK